MTRGFQVYLIQESQLYIISILRKKRHMQRKHVSNSCSAWSHYLKVLHHPRINHAMTVFHLTQLGAIKSIYSPPPILVKCFFFCCWKLGQVFQLLAVLQVQIFKFGKLLDGIRKCHKFVSPQI